MSRGPDDKDRGLSRATFAATFTFAISTLLASLIAIVERLDFSIPWFALAIGLAVLGSAAAGVLVFLIFRRTRFADLRVALTGAPGAGKTVFANIVFDRLMSQTTPFASFTADSATAISVYQTIRGIDDDVWPAHTTEDSVYKYLGKLRYSHTGRSLVVNLEIGDTAGEHWLDLARRGHDAQLEKKSPYLEYVISAQAIVHVIACDALQDESLVGRLRREVQDLLVASQLMKATRGDADAGLLVVLSKADLLLKSSSVALDYFLSDFIDDAVHDATIFTPSELARKLALLPPMAAGTTEAVLQGLKDVCTMATTLADTFRHVTIMLASVHDSDRASLKRESPIDLLEWIRLTAIGAPPRRARKRVL